MRYKNFDLWIDRANDGGYPLRAAAEASGEGRGFLSMKPGGAEIRAALERLAGRETNRDFLSGLGTELYRRLFQGDIEALFQRCYGEVLSSEDLGIRLRLRIEAPEIAILPWELLYSTMTGSFLGTQLRCPIVRYQELLQPIRMLSTALPLRMLVAIPESRDPFPTLDVEGERTNLTQALEGVKDCVAPTILEGAVTPTRISDVLMDEDFHCFHFIGHGLFQGERGFLVLNAEDGGIEYADEQQFAGLFRNHQTMKLVVLNACKGAEVSSSRPLVGVAPQLVKLGIPAVVAMQYAIYDEVAVLFAREFYRSLFRGRNKGRVEMAMSHARNRLASEFPDDRDLATPVLFMRAHEGVLFNPVPVSGRRAHDMPFSREALHTAQAVAETYRRNIRFLEEQRETARDPDLDKEIHKENDAFLELKRRLRFRNYSLVSAIIAVIIMLFLSWVGLFDFLTLDTKVESYTMWLGDLFADKTFSKEIAIVSIDKETEQFFGHRFDRSWRRRHAALIDTLSRAGVKVIALDMVFEEWSHFDPSLIEAVRRARERGTAVIVGIRDLDERNEGEPKLVRGLREAVSGFGLLCVGKKLGYARVATLAVLKGDGHVVPSLTLKAVLAYRGGDIVDVDPVHRQITVWNPDTRLSRKIGFSNLEVVERDQPLCPAIREGDRSADVFIDLSPAETLLHRSGLYSYEQMIDTGRPAELSGLEGKIVLVGVQSRADRFVVYRGFEKEERSGLELHADALNAVLRGTPIRSLGQGGQLLIMLCLGLLGAFLRYRNTQTRSRLGMLVVPVVLIGYLGFTIYVYSQYRLLLNTLYHLAAFFIAYWTTGKLRRRWFS